MQKSTTQNATTQKNLENLHKIKQYNTSRRNSPATREKGLNWSRHWRAENAERVAFILDYIERGG